MLYEQEIGGKPLDEVLERHRSNPGFPFAEKLVRGLQEHRSRIDEILSAGAGTWKPDRMPVLDRALLRIALFEILYMEDVPAAVSVNEAVELAKIYSTEESSSFINGVLGSFLARSQPC